MSMSMSLISSAPASHTTTDEGTIALHAPSQSPSMSSPSSPSVSQAPIVVQEGSQGSDGSTEPPSLIPTNVTSPSISPTARSVPQLDRAMKSKKVKSRLGSLLLNRYRQACLRLPLRWLAFRSWRWSQSLLHSSYGRRPKAMRR